MATQSKIVTLVLDQPDDLYIEDGVLWHHKKRFLRPNAKHSYPRHDLSISIVFRWDMLVLYPIWFLLTFIFSFGKRIPKPWRTVIIENSNQKRVAKINYVIDYKDVK